MITIRPSSTVLRVTGLLLCLTISLAPAAAQAPRPTEFRSGDVSIRYEVHGTGVPVVLIHGFTGSAQRHFGMTGIMDALEKAGYQVIALDCRGHGQSGKPLEASQYGIEMVRDVVRLLDHLMIDRAHVVGYSMGGGIAQQMLVKHPTRVLTATLLGTGWEGENLSALTAQLNALADGFDRRDASGLIRGVQRGRQGEPSDADVVAATADLFSRNDPQVLAVMARTLPSLWQISRDELRAIRVPVMAIAGELDQSNLEAAKRMATVVATLRLIELPGLNHATSVRPSARHIVEFLNQHDPPHRDSRK